MIPEQFRNIYFTRRRWLFSLWFLNALVCFMIAAYVTSCMDAGTIPLINTAQTIFFDVFMTAQIVGHLTVLLFLPTLLLWLFIHFFPARTKGQIALAILLYSTFLVFYLADSFIFVRYHFHFNGIVWRLLWSRDVLQFLDVSLSECLVFFGVMLAVFLLEAVLVWMAKALSEKGYRWVKCCLMVALVSALLSYLSYLFILSHVRPKKSAWAFVATTLIHQSGNLPAYNLVASWLMLGQLSASDIEVSGETAMYQPNSMAQALPQYPLQPLSVTHPKKTPNVLWIVIDTWRADTLSPSITPHLFAYAAQNIQFLDHLSGGNCTGPGIFSLFYALPAPYWSMMYRAQRGPLWLSFLKKTDYQLGIYASAPLTQPPFDKTVFAGMPEVPLKTPGDSPDDRDRMITQRMTHFLTARAADKKPFFGFLFYDGVHAFCDKLTYHHFPFKPWLKTCNRLFTPDASHIIALRNRYRNAAYFVDGQVQTVLTDLKQLHLSENTIVIITADHGESLYDDSRQIFGHAINFTQYELHVPLIVHWPGRPSQVISHATYHQDIVPTLLQGAFGVSSPVGMYSSGTLLWTAHPQPFYIAGSYIGFGVLYPGHILEMHYGGGYVVQDAFARPEPYASVPMPMLQEVFKSLRKFSRVAR